MAETLAQRGHQVHVVTYYLGTGRVEGPVIVHRIRRMPTYRKTSPGVAYQKLLVLDPLLTMKLARVLHGQRFDVIHAHHYEGLLAAATARLGMGLPLVYDAHTLLASELPYNRLGVSAGVKRTVGRWLDHRLPRRADHVIAVTETIRDKLVGDGIVPDARISVVSNGVEIDRFDLPMSSTRRSPVHAPTLIFAGNLANYQRIDLLLEAFGHIREARSDVRLQLVTDSSFDPYESQARERGIRGAVDLVQADFEKLPALLGAADVALNPRTECDGIPLKLLNYMAASRPVVSFAGSAPGIRHGETGWLADNGDVSAFAQGALALLADRPLAERIGRKARRHVEQHHTWQRMTERIEEAYAQVLGTTNA